MYEFWVVIALCILPIYFANGGAMVFGGGTPLDLDRKFFDGRPIFGKGKTLRGSMAGLLIGLVTVYAINLLFAKEVGALIPNYPLYGSLLSAGAVAGDLVSSFFKRRFGIQRGSPVFLLDQLNFVAGALLFGAAVFVPGLLEIAAIIVLTVVIHKATNFIAFKIKMKKVPW